MGHGINISCKSCGYSKEFMLGIGFAYFSLENIINDGILESNIMKKEIMDILSCHTVNKIVYERSLFRCENCNELFDKFYVELKYDNDETYRTKYMCPKCQKVLLRISEKKITKTPCPKCHKTTLSSELSLLWD